MNFVLRTLNTPKWGRNLELRTWNLEPLIWFVMILLFPIKGYTGDTGLMGTNRQLFQPVADQTGIYNLVGTEIPPSLKLRTGFATSFGNTSDTVVVPATGRQVEILDYFWQGDFMAASGYWDHWSAGLTLPVLFVENGTNFNTLQSFTTSALGDLRLDLKYRFAKETQKFPAVAFFSRFSFPTGSQAKWTGERGVTWDYRIVAEKSFEVRGSKFDVLGNVGFKIRKNVRVLSSEFGDAFTFGVGGRYQLPWQNKTWAVESELVGEKFFSDTRVSSVPLEIRFGGRKEFTKKPAQIFFGVGKGLTNAVGSPTFRVFGGVTWQF